MGGRMPLSSQMAALIRQKLEDASDGVFEDKEMEMLAPLLRLQMERSAIPRNDELLIEKMESKDGHHVIIYPFEGRIVHEILAGLVAYRIGRIKPLSFSLSMNDYGFELLSDETIPIEDAIEQGLYSPINLFEDLTRSLNDSQMAKRRFRDIATISGLVFQGFPGKNLGAKHLQANSQLLFDVFREYEPSNLLVQQAFEEVVSHQLEKDRMTLLLQRLSGQKVLIRNLQKISPFAFPIIVDRLRGMLSSESLEARIEKMKMI